MKQGTDPYENLASAIILQAVKDYRAALRVLNRSPGNHMAMRTVKEVERFFRSGWFMELTELDGEFLIRKIKGENQSQSEGS